MTAAMNRRTTTRIVTTIMALVGVSIIIAGDGAAAAPSRGHGGTSVADPATTATTAAKTLAQAKSSYHTMPSLTTASGRSARRSPRRASISGIQLGFFCAKACALPTGQVSVGPGTNRGASLIHRDGTVIGRYIDDTYPGDSRALAAHFRMEHVGLILVGTNGESRSLGPGTTNVVEHYPVLDRHSVVTPPPSVPRGSGYILQSFSWGDNVTDGIEMGRCSRIDSTAKCKTRYSAPTLAQMRRSWCLARRTRASTLLWYYHSAANAQAILGIERDGCAR